MTKLPPASDGMVVYEGVSKFFPVRVRPDQKERPELMVALDRVEASVRKGELVTLLGPSGCGKTTLLRLTAGLIAADEGRITIAGVPVTGARKDACMVFQNFGLLPWRTVLGNVEFPLEIDGVGAAEPRYGAAFHRAGGTFRFHRALSSRAVRRNAAAGRHRARADAQAHSHLHG